MPDTVTTLANLIDPQVMADDINAKITDNLTFADLADIDSTLAGQAGDTLTLPRYAYIGDAIDVAEGDAIDTVALSATSVNVTVKKAAKGVSITDEAALSGYGDPIGEINNQLGAAIAQKVDADCKAALDGITAAMTYDASGFIPSTDVIAAALVKFGEDIDGDKALLIAPAQLAQLRKDPSYMNASEVSAGMLMSGSVGMIWGCNIIVRNKIKPVGGKYVNFIVKPGALRIFLKRDTNVEAERVAKNKRTDIYADKIYVAYLYDQSKAVKLITSETETP